METKLNINAIPDGSIGKDKITEEVSNILDSVNNKQETLVSSVNIKTIKGKDILGEGNIEFEENVEAVDTAETIDELDKTPNLKYTTQILTEEEKTVARSNIDSLSPKDLKTVNGYTLVGTGNIILSDEVGKINSIDIDSTENGVDININNSLLATIPNATTENSGVMSPGDKSTIDNINAAIEEGEKRVLRKLFIAAGALYNDANVPVTRRAPWGEKVQHLAGHYYLNGLGDITEDEMAVIYCEKYRLMLLTGRDRAAQQVKVRTFWVNQANDNIRSFYKITDPYMAFYGCANLEVLTFVASSANFVAKNTAYIPSISSTINYMLGFVADCPKLKYISALNVSDIALMQPSWGTIPPFRGCVSLIEVSLFGLKCDVSFVDSPNISKRSVLYAIENGLPVTAITIILHAEAYARLAEDTDIVAALEAQPLVSLVSA